VPSFSGLGLQQAVAALLPSLLQLFR
jgi:hypothetical protein